MTWFRKIFTSSSQLTEKNIDTVRRSLSVMDGSFLSPIQQIVCPTIQSCNIAAPTTTGICNDGDCECVTPAASVVEVEFGFRDAECLNQKLRSLPELQGIDMGLWTRWVRMGFLCLPHQTLSLD